MNELAMHGQHLQSDAGDGTQAAELGRRSLIPSRSWRISDG